LSDALAAGFEGATGLAGCGFGCGALAADLPGPASVFAGLAVGTLGSALGGGGLSSALARACGTFAVAGAACALGGIGLATARAETLLGAGWSPACDSANSATRLAAACRARNAASAARVCASAVCSERACAMRSAAARASD
jgi:hypothetical protein